MKIIVYLGTGGVGKTSIAAATSLAEARAEKKSLVLTIDPALRLRTTLHLKAGVTEQLFRSILPRQANCGQAFSTCGDHSDDAVRLYGKSSTAIAFCTSDLRDHRRLASRACRN
jgi:cellulose biosynthesis protein BcsQ